MKNVIVYSKEFNSDKVYETRITSQINVSYLPAHTEGKDIQVVLSPYISQLEMFLDDNENKSGPFIDTMCREMLECYSLLANCRYLKVKETVHINSAIAFISEITVDSIIYPE